MTSKKSFLIVLRIFFILFSLQFIRDALHKWDGYSYYIPFIEFLPDLSLSFILWTTLGMILAFAFWLITYGLSKVSPGLLKNICFEHIMVWCILVVSAIIIKKTFFDNALSGLADLSRTLLIIGAGILTIAAIWFTGKYINFEKILYRLDASITPLVWLFALLLILSVPFSVLFNKGSSAAKYLTANSVNVAHLNEKQPNIILIIMDALTAGDMQLYGYHRPTTPFISEWARDAIVFNRAYSSSNWTTPATMSIMTGQRPWTHRVWYRAENHPVSNYENSLPKVLRDYDYDGYALVQNNHAHPKTLGIDNAFSIKDNAYTFWIPKAWWVYKLADFYGKRRITAEWIFENNFITKQLKFHLRHPIYSTGVLSETVYNRFLEYIPENSGKPFFAWIHVYPPHDLYLPPKPYMGIFGDAEKFKIGKEQYYSGLFHSDYDPERQKDVDILRKRYDEFILYSDKQFELFLTRLAETVDLSNTVIILTSDHGESFSQGFFGHDGPHLYEPLVRVPLIIKIPGRTNGKSIDMMVEQIDIAPTILELAGIPVPVWMEGRSLFPLIEDGSLEPRPIFSMKLIKNRVIGNHPITKGTIAVWDGDYKLIYYVENKKSLLFNLISDPGETQNIFEEKREIAQRLKKLIVNNLSHVNTKIIQRAKK